MFARNNNHLIKSTKKYASLFLLLFVSIQLSAENNTFQQNSDSIYNSYSGVVVDKKNGDKLPYAHIVVGNTGISTVTNSDGEFVIKILPSLQNENIKISSIGYETLSVPINSLKEQKNKITLTQSGIILPEVNVMPSDPLDLVKKMLDERKKNYSDKDKMMRAFYREIIRKRNTPVSISEAIVDIYKQSYSDFQQDKAYIFKSRKSSDYNKLDTLVFKLMGGPYNTLFTDVIKYPEYFLNYNNLGDYTFRYLNNETIDDRLIYVVEFKQVPSISDPLPHGELYIDAQTFGLVKADFDINLEHPETTAMLFIRKKPFNARVFATKAHYMIDYKMIDGKWSYAYCRVDLGLKIDWKRRLFNTYYNTSIEMAATDWSDNVEKKNLKDRIPLKQNVVLFDQINGFQDSDFWGADNIIEPEKSIESAIKKIQKKLKKENK